MRFGIVVNNNKQEALRLTASLTAWFRERGIDYVAEQRTAGLIHEKKFCKADQMHDQCDIVISLGGDGTLLRAAQAAGTNPILGINLGQLGFLAEFSVDELYPTIERVLKKKYTLETRTQLEAIVRIGKTDKVFNALNDVTIDKTGYPRIPTISVRIDKYFLNSYEADGIIIATSTGSTAYSMSAGGPIIVPKSKVFVVTPICPHSLTVRPVVISDDKEIELQIAATDKQFFVTCDGQAKVKVSSKNIVRIRKSKARVRLIANEKRNYYDVLRKKLMWGQNGRA
jgi:NAD+ kinase